MKNKSKNKKGFTLTEVLVVVLVISILAAIAYPMYMRSITKSKAVEAINLLEMVRNKQLQNFAKKGAYFTDFSTVNNLTSDSSQENNTGATIKIKDYTLSLNTVKNCMMATYEKGNTTFTLSTSYETAGLGCTGDVCSSFGDIVGAASDVCNCGSKSCTNGYTLNINTCNCECNLGCESGGTCSGPTLTAATVQSCGNGGTQTRVCSPSCGGGTCGAWGPCTGQACAESLKPATTQSCGNCNLGNKTRVVSCNDSTGAWTAGEWSECSGGGVCAAGATQSCGPHAQQTCTSSCTWGTCSGSCAQNQKPEGSRPCGNCNLGTQTRTVSCDTMTYTWTTGSWGACVGDGECSPGEDRAITCNGPDGSERCNDSCEWEVRKPCKDGNQCTGEDTQSCGCGGQGTQTRTCNTQTGSWSSWSTCSIGNGDGCTPNSTKTEECPKGYTGKIDYKCNSSCVWQKDNQCKSNSVSVSVSMERLPQAVWPSENAIIRANLSQKIPCAVSVSFKIRGHIPCGSGVQSCGEWESEQFTIPANTMSYSVPSSHWYEWGPEGDIQNASGSNSCGYTVSVSGGVL